MGEGHSRSQYQSAVGGTAHSGNPGEFRRVMEWSGRALALPAISWPGRPDAKHAISATPQKPTDHSTTPTLDRLEAALKERGFTISPELIRLPHGGHGSEDPAATALLFGNRASPNDAPGPAPQDRGNTDVVSATGRKPDPLPWLYCSSVRTCRRLPRRSSHEL
jgi:hypothetical protein